MKPEKIFYFCNPPRARRALRAGFRRCLLVETLVAGLFLGAHSARAIVNPAGEFAGQNSDPADKRLDAIGAFSFTTWLTGEPYLVGSGKALSGITLTGDDPVRVSVPTHGYASGIDLIFQNVAGTTGLNGKVYRITVIDVNTFTLNGTLSSQFSAYISGGTSQQMSFQTDNWYGAATLIAPQLIIAAKHLLNNATDANLIAAGTYSVRFRRKLDDSVQYQSSDPGSGRIYPFYVKVRKWVALPTQDIAIGILETPVTHITPLSVEMAKPATNRDIILAGWGSYSQTQGSGSPRDGLRDSGSSPYKKISSSSSTSVGWPQSFSKPMTSYAVNLHDSGGAVLGVSGTNLTYLGCITGYGGATGLNWASAPTNTFGKWLRGEVYTVTYRTDGTPGASLTGWASQVVDNTGTSACEGVTANAPAGRSFVKWTLSGVDYSTSNPLTVTNITQTMTLVANFAPNQYSLTYTADTNGTISGPTPQTVNYGDNGTAVTAVPHTGYHFVNWSDSSTSNPRIDSNVTCVITVTANFSPLPRITRLQEISSGFFILRWSSTGGVRYRVQYANGWTGGAYAEGFTDIVRDATAETDPAQPGKPGEMEFTDDLTLTEGAPVNGARYYRIKLVL